MRDLQASTSQLLANTLYQQCKEGASLNINFDSPEFGYMVSVISGPVYNNVLSVNPIEVAKFIRKNMADNYTTFAGVWTDKDTGKIYFDISVNISVKNVAIKTAKSLKEIAIWDIRNNSEIRV